VYRLKFLVPGKRLDSSVVVPRSLKEIYMRKGDPKVNWPKGRPDKRRVGLEENLASIRDRKGTG
jgi:hypothetical protein